MLTMHRKAEMKERDLASSTAIITEHDTMQASFVEPTRVCKRHTPIYLHVLLVGTKMSLTMTASLATDKTST